MQQFFPLKFGDVFRKNGNIVIEHSVFIFIFHILMKISIKKNLVHNMVLNQGG